MMAIFQVINSKEKVFLFLMIAEQSKEYGDRECWRDMAK